ncbi:hypothetical protein LHYA1_G001155 [Lachnellula hyalina]|uniref:Rhodopsin domain-containing protein n=1 Tax=Lachnellula hyalina TaxID=1316788 RepID=A0A8H8R8X2_9HELO|nr:uncharacterized protein LHYA1_G001155 [Lachnellula hyalina]TVY30661.1 hypothetical protein LHYA1_G001155 [Lachnellula hyalina]
MATATSSPPFDPNEISHSYAIFIGVGGMMTFLSTISVILRFVSRSLTRSYGWDDWAIVSALVFAYGFLFTTIIVATVGKAGHHLVQLSPIELERYLQIALANNVIYNCSITSSKVSILLFYRRVFAIPAFQLATKIVGALVFGYFVSAVCGLIFAYNPIQSQWKFWLPHTTIDNKTFWLAMGIINIFLDVVILCLPQTRVWKLQMTRYRKLLLSLLFLMGGLKILIYYTVTLTVPGIWTLAETNTSIICSCLPTFPNLFRHWFGDKKPSGSGSTTAVSSGQYFRSFRKNQSQGYTDLVGTSTSTTLRNDIELTRASHDLIPKAPPAIHVQRDFLADY